MGMYTGLRCKVKLKPEFIPVIENILASDHDWAGTGYSFLDAYAAWDRSFFIPWGAIAYMPDSWGYFDTSDKNSPSYYKFISPEEWNNRIEDGWWIFQCSLKNYEYTIEAFFKLVLSNIISEAAHIEYLYEEWPESKFYDLIDGKLQRTAPKEST